MYFSFTFGGVCLQVCNFIREVRVSARQYKDRTSKAKELHVSIDSKESGDGVFPTALSLGQISEFRLPLTPTTEKSLAI